MPTTVNPDPNYLKQRHALRAGGFVSIIPTVFEPGECPPGWPDLAGFPVSVAFTGIRPNGKGQAPVLTSVYWIDPLSFCETDTSRTVEYWPHEATGCHVVLTQSKADQSWEGIKYYDKDQRVIAHGGDFQHFIIQLTLRGLEPDELALPNIVPEEIGAVGIYVWTPTGEGGAL